MSDENHKETPAPEQKTLIADCDEAGDCDVVEEIPGTEATSESSDMTVIPKAEDAPVAVVSNQPFPTARNETEVTLNFIQQIITDPNADMAKFDKIIEWRNAERDRLAEIEFNTAMAKCQGKIEPVARNAHNTHTNSMYAKVDAIVEAIAPIYSKHGFSLSFSTADPPQELKEKGWQRLQCEISHSSGFSKIVYNDLPIDNVGAQGGSNKTELQGLASTRTYSRKYMITEIFNVALKGADQDGNQPITVAKEIKTITEDQLKELEDLLAKSDTTAESLCEQAGIHLLSDLKPGHFQPAIDHIKECTPESK